MAATLQYSLEVIGRQTIERELASLERRYAQHARAMNRTAASVGGGTSRSGSGSTGASSADRVAQKAIRDQQRAIDQQLRSRAALGRQRLREEREVSQAQSRANAAQQRAIDRQSRSQQALARQRVREERLVARERERINDARSDFVRSTVGNGARRVVGGLTAVGRAGAAMLGVGGAALAATSVNSAVRLDEQTRRLSIASRERGEAGISPDELRRQFTNTGIASGYKPEEVAAGVARYVAATGDIKTPLANQRTLATVAQGSDAQLTDVFAAAAELSKKLDVKSVEDMSQAFAILSAQGKKGAFELKAMASEFPEVFSSAANAGVRGLGGVRDVGATMQLAMDATGNSSEASTAVNAMFRQLAAKAKQMQSGEAFGGRKVSVYEGNDPTKPMRNFAAVAIDAISASRGNLGQLNEVFDIRGRKALDPMVNKYREAYNKAGGGKVGDEAGRAAAAQEFARYRDLPADFSEVQRDAADAMKSTSVQLEILNTKLQNAVASELFPALQRLTPELERLVPLVGQAARGFVDMLSFFARNPFLGLGSLVAGSILLEIAKAGIGAAVSRALMSLIASTPRIPAGLGTAPALPGLPAATGTTGAVLAGAGRALGGGLVGGALGYGVGSAINGEQGAETGAWIGGGAGAGFMLGGPLGAAVGGAWGAAADQASALYRESGGLDFWNYDENLNAKARAEAKARDGAGDGSGQQAAAAAAAQQEAAEQQQRAAQALIDAASALKLGGPNRGDRPTGIK